jgi:hypothetical protein
VLLYLAPCLIGDPARGIAEWRSGLASLSDGFRCHVDLARVGETRIWRVRRTVGASDEPRVVARPGG